MTKSFYDLDYYIELNERRDENLRAEYDRTIGKISNIVIIYSAISVFLIAIWKDFFRSKVFYKDFFAHINIWYFIVLLIFLTLFITSFVFTLRFLYPKALPSLIPSRNYYGNLRHDLESKHRIDGDVDQTTVDVIVKAAYLFELEESVEDNLKAVTQKQAYYFNAFRYSLFSILPFVICLIFHNFQEDKPNQVEIINTGKNHIFVEDTIKVRNIK